MNKLRNNITLLFMIIFSNLIYSASISNSVYTANITLRDGCKLRAYFISEHKQKSLLFKVLMVNRSRHSKTEFCQSDKITIGEIISIPINSIDIIWMKNIDRKWWIPLIITTQVLPSASASVAALTQEPLLSLPVLGSGIICSVPTALLFRRGSKKRHTYELNKKTVTALQLFKFARYPQGLNDDKLSKILKAHGQHNLTILEVTPNN